MSKQPSPREPRLTLADGPGALDGVRVVDFTEYMAGPYCTMMLADMGAEVIKVEPTSGDHWRHNYAAAPNESWGFLGANRGKRSVALDLRSERGRALAQRLLRTADVVVVGFRPERLEQLGLDYETARALRPEVIYADITAFGHHGPYSHRGGFDGLAQAASGIMAAEGKVEHGTPVGLRAIAPADVSTGMFTAFAIASALFHRARTGSGQAIHANLFATALAIQYRQVVSIEAVDRPEREALRALSERAREQGLGYEELQQLRREAAGVLPIRHYFRVYQTRDGWVTVNCLNNRLRRALRDLVIGPEALDPAIEGAVFDTTLRSPEPDRALQTQLEARFRERTTSDWLELLDAAGVPAARFNFVEELYDDPHVAANDLLPTSHHPVLGEVRTGRTPIEMSESRTGAASPSPTLGADSYAVLADLGLEEAELRELEADGVIVQWRPEAPVGSAARDQGRS